jgi:hypothetical protein
MFDKSKQLVIRVDLYFGYILSAAVVVSVCEMPLLALRIEAARYILPFGWLALLLFAVTRMWNTKITHGLTSELQVYKIVVGGFIIWMCSWYAYMVITNPGWARIDQFSHIAEIAFVLNLAMAFNVMSIGVLGIFLFDKLQAFTRATSL